MNPLPRNEGSDNLLTAATGSSEAANPAGYRCPVCGETVDPTSPEEILRHHEHVTHPHHFLSARSLAA